MRLSTVNYRVVYTDPHGITYTALVADVRRAQTIDGPVSAFGVYPDGSCLSPGCFIPARHFILKEGSAD